MIHRFAFQRETVGERGREEEEWERKISHYGYRERGRTDVRRDARNARRREKGRAGEKTTYGYMGAGEITATVRHRSE